MRASLRKNTDISIKEAIELLYFHIFLLSDHTRPIFILQKNSYVIGIWKEGAEKVKIKRYLNQLLKLCKLPLKKSMDCVFLTKLFFLSGLGRGVSGMQKTLTCMS